MSNKWISVKDEENFPETHQDVLTINPVDGTAPSFYIVDFCFLGADGKKHWDWGENNVTHWQPLPPPPGEEDNLSKEPIEPIIGPINWEEVQKEMNEWEEERKVRSAKAAIEVASIHFTSELGKEPISEDELKEKFKNVLPMGMPSVLNDCIEIAQQYSGSKLEELEKWCDEKIKEYYHPNEPIASEKYASPYKQLKSKIQSLK